MSANILMDLSILVTVTCTVFAIASLFDAEKRAVPLSIRKGNALDEVMSTRLGNRLIPDSERKRAGLRLRLLQAGFDSPRATQTYYGIRLILAVALPLSVLAASSMLVIDRRTIPIAIAAASALGFLLPAFSVARRRQRRQRVAREGFPDMLDLLLVCTEAGLGIDMAILKVGEELADTHPLLSEHLRQVSAELRAGRSRADAMRVLAARTGIDEAISLVNLLVQSDALGTSMAATLHAFSEDMRARRILRAEEMAHKVGVKLSVLAVTCFLPAIMVAVMTPVLFSITETLGNISKGATWHP
jgi:tight adherence protein C